MATKVFKGVKSTALPDTYVNSPASVAPLFSASTAYAKGDQVYNGLKLYRFTANHAAGAWTGSDVEEVTVGGQLKTLNEDTTELKQDLTQLSADMETKANIDGSYDNMTVGNAKQLVATVGITDKVPYNFRTSGGSADIGDREVDKIVGGTVVWNQMIKNGDFANGVAEWMNYNCAMTASNGIATVTPTNRLSRIYQVRDVILNHKYLMSAEFKGTYGEGNAMLSWYGGVNQFVPFSGGWQIISILFNNTFQTAKNWQLHYGATQNENNVAYQIRNAVCFDLTQMFGSTIADYIYGLEQSQAGAGVAWFKKLFPKPYYAYDAGSLMSVQTSEHKMVGFNQWDEEWEVYGSSGQIKSKNRIPVVEGATYFLKSPTGCTMYLFPDATSPNVGYVSAAANNTFTIPQGVHYITMYTAANYGTTYNNDICINLSWDGERDGEYEPYVEYVYPLDDSLTLRGIPKLDSGNNLYYDGDVYEADGTVTRRYGVVVIDGVNETFSGAWEATDNGYAVYKSLSSWKSSRLIANAISDKFIFNSNGYASMPVMTFVGGSGAAATMTFILPSTVTKVAEANAWAAQNPITVIYELATPNTETADPFTNPQIVDDFGTEEYVDAGVTASTPTRDVAIPVGHETVYQANLRAKLEMSPNSPDGDGDYIVRQTNGENEYVLLEEELPSAPSSDGTYVLKATVASGTATLTWVEET